MHCIAVSLAPRDERKNYIVKRNIVISIFLSCICMTLVLYGCVTIHECKSTQTVNPLQYGLGSATTGEERYNVLLRCHNDAIKKGVGVSYKGIKKIDLVVPASAISIPLSDYTDFANVVISVGNNNKSLALFEKQQQMSDVIINKDQIDNGNYRNNPVLRKGVYLLVVEDAVPWVKKRDGYEYGAIRRDVFLIKNGVSKGRPVSNYSTLVSQPKGKYCAVGDKKTVVKNLRFERWD